MGLFSLLFGPNINDLAPQAQADEQAVILDVREEDEFMEGHILGALNIPVERIVTIERQIPDKATPLYVYCLTGARSKAAVTALKRLGYSSVTNMGAIKRWQGDIERGRDMC